MEDAPQLLELISNVVSVERFGSEAYVVMTDRSKILAAAARLTMLLLEHPEDVVSSEELKKQYELTFGIKVGCLYLAHDFHIIENCINDWITSLLCNDDGLPDKLMA